MIALDSAHVSLALGCPTLLVARMSSGDERTRHRGISHHTLTVLDLLLEPVTVALPAGMRSPVGADLRRVGLGAVFGGAMPQPAGRGPARRSAIDRRAASAHHPPRLAPRDGRPAGVRRQRPAGRDDGPRAGRGPAVLRRRARRRERARAARRPSWIGQADARRAARGMSGAFEPLGGETVYRGRLVDVRIERFRHADGEEVSREIVRHRGAVGSWRYDARAGVARAPAARGGRRARPAGDPRRAPGRGRRAAAGRRRSASSPRRSAAARAAGSRSSPTTRAPASPTSACTCSARATCIRRRRTATRTSASRSCLAAGRAAGGDRGVPRREDADRPAVARAPAEP